MSFSKPIFMKRADCPNVSTFEFCSAAEKVCGNKSMKGAQSMGDIWRIYPATDDCRATLLASELSIKEKLVTIYSGNPFAVRGRDWAEIPGTRLSIDGIPISSSEADIAKKKIRKYGSYTAL